MLIITSPSKILDFAIPFQVPYQTQPSFLREADLLMQTLKKKSVADISKIMNVNTETATLNYDRFQIWQTKHTMQNSRPAIVAYSGDIYGQIHENSYTESQSKYLQETLRIISGLYGVLHPYDLIQPYRLEMNVNLENPNGTNLYQYWKEKITTTLKKELETKGDSYLINLASSEYSQVINIDKLGVPIITVVFNQQKDGKVNNIGFLGKKARGMMIDFMVKNQIYDVQQLETFDVDGYKFIAKTPNSLLFVKEV